MATSILLHDHDLAQAQILAELVRDLNSKGHNPATSGNYSLRSVVFSEAVVVSESGIDKSLMAAQNFLLVDKKSGELFADFKNSPRKSSDETGLHLAVYRATTAGCVLHSHLLESILFADVFQGQNTIKLTGLELLKGLKGIKSHDDVVLIPCLDNSQDIKTLSDQVEKILQKTPAFAFILRGHGIYVWGETIKDAKRHLEVFEYVFKYFLAAGARKII